MFSKANWCTPATVYLWLILSKEGIHPNRTTNVIQLFIAPLQFIVQSSWLRSARATGQTLQREASVSSDQFAGNGKARPLPLAMDPKAFVRTPRQPSQQHTAPVVRADLLHAAFQIHHGPAQYLATALMKLRLCERYISEDVSRANAMLHESLEGVQAALDIVRATIEMLRCSQVTSQALEWNLHAMVEQLRSTCAAGFYEDMDDVGRLSQATAVGLAEIGCEALTNAVKHASAKQITVGLHRRRSAVVLEVMDDGKGFSSAEMVRRRGQAGLGLLLMRGRAHQLGSTLSIESACPGGTLVRTVVPMSG